MNLEDSKPLNFSASVVKDGDDKNLNKGQQSRGSRLRDGKDLSVPICRSFHS